MAPTLTIGAALSLRERRRLREMTQQRLAEMAGCSLSMVRVLEAGAQPAHSAVLQRIEAVLNDESPAGSRRGSRTTSRGGDASDGLHEE